MAIKVVASGASAKAVEANIQKLIDSKFASRLFSKDFTLWGSAAESESSIRLGWTTSAQDSKSLVERISQLREEFRTNGITRVVLCGMGGSSLAPEVIAGTSGVDLVVLDSTNPDQVIDALTGDLSSTVVVVSSKSGSTVETDSQKRLFEKAFTESGIQKQDRIIIVTDPGSPMESAAKQDGYRIFNADPTVGGRYSALTAFGLVPSGLAGVDIAKLLADASASVATLSEDSASNPGLVLGIAMAETVLGDKPADKLGIVNIDSPLVGFGDWAEQLIAESTGKLGVGVLPVVLDSDSPELSIRPDDLLVCKIVRDALDTGADEVQVSGSLGEQFLLWEVATVVAGALLGINPFDQPDVESAKIAARAMLDNRAEVVDPLFIEGDVEVRAHNLHLTSESDLKTAISTLLGSIETYGYFSIHSYLDRIGVSEFADLRDVFAAVTKRPTTFGWAPRFLHSTGQYHKGGPKQGVYLQITALPHRDIAVPGRDFTLGELIASQAAGDAKVLADHGRPVLTLTINNLKNGLLQLERTLKSL